MFDNIGKKIMVLAKAIAILGIIASVIISINLFVQASNLSSYYYSESKSSLNTIAWSILIGGSLGSWIGSFVLFAFGQLVDNTADIKQNLLAQPLSTISNVPSKSETAPRPLDYSDLPQL